MSVELAAFERAMAVHLAELRQAQERQRRLPIAAQLGVIGVAGGAGLIWLAGHASVVGAAGGVAGFSGMALYIIALVVDAGRSGQREVV